MSSSKRRKDKNYPWLFPVIGILVVVMIITAVVLGTREQKAKPSTTESTHSAKVKQTEPDVVVNPHDTIKRFEDAFNAGDWEEIGQCIEPESRAEYTRQMKSGENELEEIKPFLPKLYIEIERMEYAPDHMTADAHLKITTTQVSGEHAGEDLENRTIVKMVKIDGKWYFHMVDGQIIQISPLS